MYGGGSQQGNMYFRPGVTPAVKILLIAITAVFLLQLSLGKFAGVPVEIIFGYSPAGFLSGYLWQIFTYPFLHGSLTHILFNALILYMLGPEMERRWGTKRFAWYYGICALGGAILQTLIWLLSFIAFPSVSEFMGFTPVIGASGALYGLFVAFGILYGNSQVLVFFLFPMKARNFVIMLTGIEIVSAVFYSDPGAGGVAHLVHLGGLATGFLLIKFKGPNLDGGGGGFGGGRKKTMSREEVRQRLSVIVNNDEPKTGDKGQPITWN